MNGCICKTGGSGMGRAIAFCIALVAIACAAVYTVPAASADDAAACAEVSYLKEVAIPACTRLIESGNLHGADLARVYSYRGRARLWASNPRDFDPAMADHDEAVRLAPGLASVYVNRASAWVRLGKEERADEDIEKAIALAPDDAEAYFTRAEMHRYTAARREQVISDYGKAFALKPDYAEAYYGQGTLLLDQDFDRAIADYTRIIELKPDWQGGGAYQARAAAYAAKGDDPRALADRTELVRMKPGRDAYVDRGFVYLRLTDYDAAAADFQRALEFGAHPSAHTGLASVYRAKGDFDRALLEVNRAIGMAPRMAGLLVERANTYLAMGKTTEALADVDASLRPFPQDASAHLVKGRIYEAMGRKNDAIAEFQQVRGRLATARTAYDRRTLADSLDGLERLGAKP
jgi:tetratricopeptide (TPR) repeat protein